MEDLDEAPAAEATARPEDVVLENQQPRGRHLAGLFRAP